MKLNIIKKIITRLYDSAGEVVVTTSLIRKITGDLVPGQSPDITEESHTARLISLKSTGGRSGLEKGPVLEKGLKIGLLECEGENPIAGDELELPDGRVTLHQATSMDLGAGFLFEVWYS